MPEKKLVFFDVFGSRTDDTGEEEGEEGARLKLVLNEAGGGDTGLAFSITGVEFAVDVGAEGEAEEAEEQEEWENAEEEAEEEEEGSEVGAK